MCPPLVHLSPPGSTDRTVPGKAAHTLLGLRTSCTVCAPQDAPILGCAPCFTAHTSRAHPAARGGSCRIARPRGRSPRSRAGPGQPARQAHPDVRRHGAGVMGRPGVVHDHGPGLRRESVVWSGTPLPSWSPPPTAATPAATACRPTGAAAHTVQGVRSAGRCAHFLRTPSREQGVRAGDRLCAHTPAIPARADVWKHHQNDSDPVSALTQTEDADRRSSLLRMVSAGLVQTNGLEATLCSRM